MLNHIGRILATAWTKLHSKQTRMTPLGRLSTRTLRYWLGLFPQLTNKAPINYPKLIRISTKRRWGLNCRQQENLICSSRPETQNRRMLKRFRMNTWKASRRNTNWRLRESSLISLIELNLLCWTNKKLYFKSRWLLKWGLAQARPTLLSM